MNRSLFRINKGILTIANGNEEVANFDFEGRLLYFTRSGTTYRRGMNNSMYKLGWDGDVRTVTLIPQEESKAIMERSYELARNFPDETLTDEEKGTLKRVASRSYEWASSDVQAAQRLYSKLPVMPPDQSFSLFLEISSGCNWNRCTLCGSHSGRAFSPKSLEEFLKHMQEVRNHFGEGISSRKGIFLGDASAVDVDQKILLPALDELKKTFDLPIFTAFDIFSTPKKKNMIHYQDLKSHGLERIFVFIESGSYKVIKLFNEKINVTEMLNIVNNIKDYGIAISLVIMVGLGGKRFEEEHIEGTANIVSQMNLENGDMIFLSPAVEDDDPLYSEIVRKEKLEILSPEEKLQQMERLTRAVKEGYQEMNGRELTVPIVRYELRESIF